MRHFVYLILAALIFVPLNVSAQEIDQQESKDKRSNRTEPSLILNPIDGNPQANMEIIQQVCSPVKRNIRVYKMQHVAVQDAADSINEWLKVTLGADAAAVNGFICNAPVLLVVDASSNSLMVSTADGFADARKLETLIKSLDREPESIRIKGVVKGRFSKSFAINQDFDQEIELVLNENEAGSLTIKTPGGTYTIELTARIQPGNHSSKRTPAADAESGENRIR